MKTFLDIIVAIIGFGFIGFSFIIFVGMNAKMFSDSTTENKIKKENKSVRQQIKELDEKNKALDEEIARIDSFTRSIKGATNHEYIKEQQKIHFPDKFN